MSYKTLNCSLSTAMLAMVTIGFLVWLNIGGSIKDKTINEEGETIVWVSYGWPASYCFRMEKLINGSRVPIGPVQNFMYKFNGSETGVVSPLYIGVIMNCVAGSVVVLVISIGFEKHLRSKRVVPPNFAISEKLSQPNHPSGDSPKEK
ncbi:MAG: hypothetical protein HY291_18225 [Planctomycetes bacterium]|nr:hypothetical protein [Planctomycetota bacterium]